MATSPSSPPPNVGPVMNRQTSEGGLVPGRARMRALLADPAARSALWDKIAEGHTLNELARLHGINYTVFYRVIKDQCNDEYQAARAAYAETLVYQNLEVADDIAKGRTAGSDGKAAAGIRQWFAERADPDTWGQRTFQNVNVTGVIGLHMQALKAFQDETEAQAAEAEAEDADYVEILPDAEPQSVDDRPPSVGGARSPSDSPAGHHLL